ncbi:MAG: AmmeMemoRadiSam system protein B [Treponema sp.]|nr:AmmeMemoRadiSam system protein B [Treponema sp.]
MVIFPFFLDQGQYANPLSRALFVNKQHHGGCVIFVAKRITEFSTGKLAERNCKEAISFRGGRIKTAKETPHHANKKNIFSFFAALLILASTSSCSRQKPGYPERNAPEKDTFTIQTWLSQGLTEPSVATVNECQALPQDAFPLAGTVSHHLLAGAYIDGWFKALAKARKVETFFIISPSHYGLSTQEWSLCECSWNAGEYGLVHTDSKTERELAKSLGVAYDKNAFRIEHGFSTLMPYLAKYFPNAKVCAVALNGEPPLRQSKAQALTDALDPYFTKEKSKKNFLLISTDFSHHGNKEDTLKKDTSSRKFFESPSAKGWFFCVCDNRQGMYALSNIFCKEAGENSGGQKKCSVLYHTNSFELSGEGGDDITSYFFTFLY